MCLSSCKNREVKETLPLCRVMTVAAKAVEINESYSASIQGRQDIDIYPQISGTITELRVYEGKTVRKGEVMFVIDQVPYRAAWRKTMADVHAAEAQVETARLEYRSKQQLLRKSRFRIRSVHCEECPCHCRSDIGTGKGFGRGCTEQPVLYGGEKSVEWSCRHTTLPGGRIGQRFDGYSINFRFRQFRGVCLFSITEKRVHSLLRQYGSHDEVIRQMPPVRLQLNDGSLYDGQGHVESISGIINRKTGTVSVRSIFDNTNRTLLSGGIGNVIIPHREDSVIVIPQTATTELQNKILAYKVAEDGCVHSCELTVENSMMAKIILSDPVLS